MSEELLQTIPQSIGKYTYFKLGETTIKQLMETGHIPKRAYIGLLRKKPDEENGNAIYYGRKWSIIRRAKGVAD